MSLEERIVEKLEKRGLYQTTAESCTAGLLAGRIMNVSGLRQSIKRDISLMPMNRKKNCRMCSMKLWNNMGQSAHRRQRRWQRALPR